jgi:head-tail adaptor
MSPVPSVASGRRRQRVTVQNPGTPTPDGDGGYTETWTDLGLRFVQLLPATPTALARVGRAERVAEGTVTASATHLATGPLDPAVTTKTRLQWTDVHGRAHTLEVLQVVDLEDRGLEMTLVCAEVVA